MRIHIVLNISGYIQKSHSKETVRSSKAFGYGLGCDRLRGGSGYPDGINDDAGAVELGLPVAFPCKRESTRVTRGISARDLCIPACAWVGTCLETCPRINDVWRSHAVTVACVLVWNCSPGVLRPFLVAMACSWTWILSIKWRSAAA